jgi:hypothetical protein
MKSEVKKALYHINKVQNILKKLNEELENGELFDDCDYYTEDELEEIAKNAEEIIKIRERLDAVFEGRRGGYGHDPFEWE